MTIRPMLALSAAAIAMSTLDSYAGVCTSDIDRMQARIDARLEVLAAAGPPARESAGALMHHQPTPGSIAAAESRHGEISARTVELIRTAMARAREADGGGDAAACERALLEVQRAIER